MGDVESAFSVVRNRPHKVAHSSRKWRCAQALAISVALHAFLISGSSQVPVAHSRVASDELLIDLIVVERPRRYATDKLPLLTDILLIPPETEGGCGPRPSPCRFEVNEPIAALNSLNAVDRIFTEVRQILWNYNRVSIVWCFDQSTRTADCRRQIAEQAGCLYSRFASQSSELDCESHWEMPQFSRWDAQLLPFDGVITSVMCFSDDSARALNMPVVEPWAIARAIQSIPIRDVGHRDIWRHVAEGIQFHQQYETFCPERPKSRTGRSGRIQRLSQDIYVSPRKMILILCTNDSSTGDLKSSSVQTAIDSARQYNCRVYVLAPDASLPNVEYARIAYETGGIYFRCSDWN